MPEPDDELDSLLDSLRETPPPRPEAPAPPPPAPPVSPSGLAAESLVERLMRRLDGLEGSLRDERARAAAAEARLESQEEARREADEQLRRTLESMRHAQDQSALRERLETMDRRLAEATSASERAAGERLAALADALQSLRGDVESARNALQTLQAETRQAEATETARWNAFADHLANLEAARREDAQRVRAEVEASRAQAAAGLDSLREAVREAQAEVRSADAASGGRLDALADRLAGLDSSRRSDAERLQDLLDAGAARTLAALQALGAGLQAALEEARHGASETDGRRARESAALVERLEGLERRLVAADQARSDAAEAALGALCERLSRLIALSVSPEQRLLLAARETLASLEERPRGGEPS